MPKSKSHPPEGAKELHDASMILAAKAPATTPTPVPGKQKPMAKTTSKSADKSK